MTSIQRHPPWSINYMRWGASNFITTTIISYHITIIKRRSKCKEKCEEAIWRKFCASAAASLCVLWSHLGVLKGSECNVLLTEKVSKSWLRAPSIIPLLGICTLSLSLSLSLTQSQEHSLSLHSHPRRYKVGFNGNNSSKGSFDEINLCENISQSHNNNKRGNKAFKSYLSRNPGPLVLREELWVRIPVPQAGCFSFISSKNDFCLERRINGIKRPF